MALTCRPGNRNFPSPPWYFPSPDFVWMYEHMNSRKQIMNANSRNNGITNV